MADDQSLQRVREVEAKVIEDAERRDAIRRSLLRRLAEFHVFSKAFLPLFKAGDATAVDVDRVAILAIALLEAARNEHDAMVADAEARS